MLALGEDDCIFVLYLWAFGASSERRGDRLSNKGIQATVYIPFEQF